MKYGLSAQALQLIERVFLGHPEVKRVRIFGSRAMGTHRPGSDIDLALEGEFTQAQLGRIAAELDELPLPYIFDLLSWAKIDHEPLRQHIAQWGQTIYEADGKP